MRKKEAPFVCNTNGHGTLCCSALLTVNPKVEIVAVKVLNKQNQCSSERLILALEQLVETDVNIISLSLATDAVKYLDKYKQVLNKLLKQGKVILAATSNKKHSSILADMGETIGINGKMFLKKEEYWYQTKKKVLESYAKETTWEQKDLEVELVPSVLKPAGARNETVYQILAQIVISELEISNSDINSLHKKRLYEFGITKHNAITVIQKIEKELGIRIDYSKVNLYWFYSIDLLYKYITEGIKVTCE